MKAAITRLSIFSLLFLVLVSCKKDAEMPTGEFVNLKTNEAAEIKAISAVVSAKAGADCSERGVCWGKKPNPTVADFHLANGKGKGEYTCTLTDLEPDQKYYYRAYGFDGKRYAYAKDEKEFVTKDGVVKVTTGDVTDITTTSAKCSGEVTDDGGFAVTERGICWSTSHSPTTSGSHAASGTGTGSFTVQMTGLTPGTTYYVKAYAVNSQSTSYGSEVSFRTDEPQGDWVDLGLPSGLLWATRNVGASSPEGYGDYFAWAETQPKNFYDWSTYTYTCGGDNDMTKYCNRSNYGCNGYTDNLTILQAGDDAATANWGSGWRTPTEEEWQELLDHCTSVWTMQNGVNGRRFTGPNGNTLFLPAAGYREDGGLYGAGSHGHYWSSSLNTDGPNDAWDCSFSSGYSSMHGSRRNDGHSVRAVRSARQK